MQTEKKESGGGAGKPGSKDKKRDTAAGTFGKKEEKGHHKKVSRGCCTDTKHYPRLTHGQKKKEQWGEPVQGGEERVGSVNGGTNHNTSMKKGKCPKNKHERHKVGFQPVELLKPNRKRDKHTKKGEKIDYRRRAPMGGGSLTS